MSAVSIAAKPTPYQPTNKIRFVTATSLFDGHDATVNIMRRVLQASGAEVIHLGQTRGWVIRHHMEGVGVQFQQSPQSGKTDGR